MNIQNRLKKMETELNAETKGDFCKCFDNHLKACLNKVYDEPFTVSDILPDNTSVTDFCRICQKPVAERIKDIYRNIEEIYGKASLN
jgi:hypothetical protein